MSTPLMVDVRRGALGQLGEILSGHRAWPGDDIVVVVGTGIGPDVVEPARHSLGGVDAFTIGAGTLDAALALADRLRVRACDAVVAIGGGRVIDTVKYAASQQGLPMAAVATSLAHDGVASPVSVLLRDGVTVSYGVNIPLAVIVDLDYVRRSPARQTRSGIGDALSNLCATADWDLAARVRGEPVDGLARALATTGAEALLSHPGSVGDDDFLEVLANALVLGGVAMAVAGSSRPCSGGCHEIAHALNQLHPGVGTHGEQVGLGALFCTYLRGDESRFGHLVAAFGRHGLVRTPDDLGLTPEQFAAAVELAPSTRPGRYTILEHLQLSPREIALKIAGFTHAIG